MNASIRGLARCIRQAVMGNLLCADRRGDLNLGEGEGTDWLGIDCACTLRLSIPPNVARIMRLVFRISQLPYGDGVSQPYSR